MSNKKYIYIFLIVIVALVIAMTLTNNNRKVDNKTDEYTNDTIVDTDQKTETSTTQDPTANDEKVDNLDATSEKIIPNDTLCSQITKEYVAKTLGINIEKVGTNTDFSITACNYYLTNEEKSPYIAVILNKNLSVEVQRAFYTKQKLDLITDQRIVTEHIIYKDTKEDRIAHIDLVLDPTNFIRIDRSVERAIDNNGLINLAVAISKRL